MAITTECKAYGYVFDTGEVEPDKNGNFFCDAFDFSKYQTVKDFAFTFGESTYELTGVQLRELLDKHAVKS